MLVACVMFGFDCPRRYERENLIGMTAGLIDGLVDVGSALAGLFCEGSGARVLYLCWTAAAFIGAACLLIAGCMMRRYRNARSAENAV